MKTKLLIKESLKTLIIFVLALYGVLLAAWLVIKLSFAMAIWGRTGAILHIFCVTVLPPVISSTLVIGILGGIWLKLNAKTGYLLAFALAIFHSSYFIMAQQQTTFWFVGPMILVALIAVTLSGGFAFFKIKNPKRQSPLVT